MSDFYKRDVMAENHGMAGGESYVSIEDLYQEFKARLISELLVSPDGFPEGMNLFDNSNQQ